jgi:hypothetical protein
MGYKRRQVLKVLASSAAAALTTKLGSKDAQAAGSAIQRDVCVIGGGSAGTYAAIRLRDAGHSVVVLERTQRLGGHAETFRDSVSGPPIDIGVIIFPDNNLVRSYFGRFNVALSPSSLRGGASQFVDFRTGLPVDAFNPTQAELGAGFLTYLQLLTSRFGFLEQNGYRLPGPGPLLDELLLPFGQFAEQHGITAILPTMFLYVQGFGALLDVPALYVLKNMSASVVTAALTGGFLMVPQGAGALYDAATASLGRDVVFGADVRLVRRTRNGVRLLIHTPSGLRAVHCKKLIVTAPPALENLHGFDLDVEEFSSFARFRRNHYWTGVVRVAGAPAGVSLVNAAPETPYNIAPLPGIYSLSPSAIPGLLNVKYGSARHLFDARVRAAIRRDIQSVQVPGIGPMQFNGFATFKNHSPYALMVRREDIRAGFYATLEGLQGHNHTYYASATFQTHNSAAIWAYIEDLLPRISNEL